MSDHVNVETKMMSSAFQNKGRSPQAVLPLSYRFPPLGSLWLTAPSALLSTDTTAICSIETGHAQTQARTLHWQRA